MERKHIYTNELQKTAKTLNAGDTILLSGTIYTARDAAHKRMFEALDHHLPLPFDLKAYPSARKTVLHNFSVHSGEDPAFWYPPRPDPCRCGLKGFSAPGGCLNKDSRL